MRGCRATIPCCSICSNLGNLRGQVFRAQMAEAAAQQAAAVAHARALAALAREMLADVGGGDVFSCVRLLFTELAAALHVELGRQAQEDADDAACQGWRSRAQRRRAQRKRAMRALIGARRGVDTHAGGEGGEHDKAKSRPLVFWEAAAKPSALGERHVTADAVLDAKDREAGRDAGASARGPAPERCKNQLCFLGNKHC